MPKLKVKKVIIFKHGISYYILEGKIKGNGTFELEFEMDEMNDILKSLFVIDTSEKGYISSISYDLALDTYQLLKSVMLEIPDEDSLSSLLKQIKGAQVKIEMSGSKVVSGTIMGIEFVEKFVKDEHIVEKLIILLQNEGFITKIAFSDMKSIDIVNEDIKKDLKFFLDTIIAGKKKDTKKIVINCESGGDDNVERKIIVSYIRESPIWKTSYRLIKTKEQLLTDQCLISGWCLVENTTNQDWEDVELTLVAGMPVSFKYDFYKPIYMERPVIKPPRVLSAKPTEMEEEMFYEGEEKAMELEAAPKMAKPYLERKKAMAPPAPMALRSMRPGGVMGTELSDAAFLDKIQSQTSIQTKDMGELFEYKISKPVTINRKQSALVPILAKPIKARRILLYNPDQHDKNPNACLELINNTEFVLERGPAIIVFDNNLAGEAIIPFMNKGDERILNYAVEQAVLISHEKKTENLDIHKVKFSGGYSYEYYFTNQITTYTIKNKSEEEKEIYLDHPKTKGYKVIESVVEPKETANYWRFKFKLEPKNTIKFKIKEQKENYTSYLIWNWSKNEILGRTTFYVRKRFIDENTEKILKEIAELIYQLNELQARKDKLLQERETMTKEQERLRKNISVLGDDSQSIVLKERYVKKFTDQENRFESITTELKTLDKEIKELNKKIDKKLNAL